MGLGFHGAARSNFNFDWSDSPGTQPVPPKKSDSFHAPSCAEPESSAFVSIKPQGQITARPLGPSALPTKASAQPLPIQLAIYSRRAPKTREAIFSDRSLVVTYIKDKMLYRSIILQRQSPGRVVSELGTINELAIVSNHRFQDNRQKLQPIPGK
ncbi:hypothetical protein Bbelb_385730 [Branchiostoma belcheri]|nr:hypothetical protein Bbelb_385730 [Branchiostoma belcheri]